MDTEALVYAGEGFLQSSSCQAVTVRPVSAVKLLYKDCLLDANRTSVSAVQDLSLFFFLPLVIFRQLLKTAVDTLCSELFLLSCVPL